MSLRDLKKLDRDDVLDLVGLAALRLQRLGGPGAHRPGRGAPGRRGAGPRSWPPRPVPSCVTTCATGSAPPQDSLPERFRSVAANAEAANRSP